MTTNMKEFINEVNYFHHHRTLEKISNRKPTLSKRIFRLQQNAAQKDDGVFKTGGHFKIRGNIVNDDQYFDHAHKVNLILADKIKSILNRK